jgi:Ca-activated chloride channel homolog
MQLARLGAARRAVRLSLIVSALGAISCSTADSVPPIAEQAAPRARTASAAPSSDSAGRVAEARKLPQAAHGADSGGGEAMPEQDAQPSESGKAGGKGIGASAGRAVPRSAHGVDSVLNGASTGVTTFGVGGLATRGSGAGGGGYGSGEGGLGAYGNKSDRDVTMSMSGSRPRVASEPPPPPASGGNFVHAGTNPIVSVAEDALSTFAVDVDTGSYFYARRFLELGRAPAPASVRVEEWVNALGYAYAPPTNGDDRFSIHLDAAPSPFSDGLTLVRVALKGKVIEDAHRKPAHIVFLVDVSGSMMSGDKLAWAQESMDTAVSALRDDDSVAIVTYAGATGVVLPATSARHKDQIRGAIRALQSGGGTNMGSGMELAYREATKELSSARTARVIVLSDGDANIGRTTHDEMLTSIRGYVSEGVTMSTVGFGTGNYNDHLMEQLADAGNGNYTYIGSKEVMRRVFKDELTSTLEMIAQDVKIQVEWNPLAVEGYRLIGYENRDIADADFRNDKKDAGEIGAGHAVTALYEVRLVKDSTTDDLATVRVRAKEPRGTRATETSRVLTRGHLEQSTDALDADAKAALGAALAAEILRGSAHAEGLSLADAAKLLRASAKGPYAAERLDLARLLDKLPSSSVATR